MIERERDLYASLFFSKVPQLQCPVRSPSQVWRCARSHVLERKYWDHSRKRQRSNRSFFRGNATVRKLSMSVVEQSYLYCCCAEWNVKCSPSTISLEVLRGLSDVTSSHRRKKEEEDTTTSIDSLPGYLRIEEEDDDDDRLRMMAEGRKESEVEFDHRPEEDLGFLYSFFDRTTTPPLPMPICGKKRKHSM